MESGKIDAKVVVIVILFIAIAGLGGFFIGKKNGETIEKKEVSANQPALEGTNTAGFDDVETLENMINDLEYLENYVDEISEEKPLSDEMILNFSFQKAVANSEWPYVLMGDVNGVSNKYFGVDVKPGNIPCGVEHDYEHPEQEGWYLYDQANYRWFYNEEHGAHGMSSSRVYNKVVNALYRDGVYKIGVVKAYTEYTDFAGTGLYATLEDAKAKKNAVIDASDGMGAVDSMNAYLHGLFLEYDGDGFHTYEYTFEKTDTGFVLKSYKMVK